MILRELLYEGPRHPQDAIKIFIKLFVKNWTTFDKNYQKDNLWGSFSLVRTID